MAENELLPLQNLAFCARGASPRVFLGCEVLPSSHPCCGLWKYMQQAVHAAFWVVWVFLYFTWAGTFYG